MSNQQLIKSAHIWALTLLLACGLLAMAGKAGVMTQNQNSNQNSNSNSNANSNTNSATQNQNHNMNMNRSANRNSGASATSAQAGMSSLNSQDRDFLMDAAMGGLEEVELGRWATQKGTSEAVKQFGQRMVTDHSQANTELMTLATSKGITLPSALDEKHQKEVAKITAMSGAAFDRAYAKKMLSDHKKDVSDFEKQSNRGTDPDLKAFAAKTLPTLQEHLQMTTTLPGNEGANVNTGASGGGEKSTNRNMSDNSNMSGGNSNMNSNSNRNRNRNSNSNRNSNGNGNSNNSNRP